MLSSGLDRVTLLPIAENVPLGSRAMMRPSDAARLLLLGAIWGSSFLFIKVALEDFGPVLIVAGRLVLGLALLLGLMRFHGRRLPRDPATLRSLAVMAVVSNLIPFTLITWGEKSITSGVASILNATTPLFTAGIASFFVAGDRLTWRRAVGIAIGFAGVGVIAGVDVNGGSLAGEIAVVLASLSYGIGFVYARKRVVGGPHGPLVLSAGQLLIAGAVATPFAALEVATNAPSLTATAATSVLALGVAGTGLGYILYYRLVEDVGPTTASFVTYLLPIVGVVLGAVALDESLGWSTLVGSAMVILGIALAESAVRSARRAVHPAETPVAGRDPR